MAETKTVSCPHCQSHVRDDGNYEGQVVACPVCAEQFQMPTAEMHAQAFADEFVTPQGQNAATTETLAYVGSESAAKPWQLTTVGALRMGSGVLNVLTGLSLFIFVVPLLLIPLGVFEIISGANLLSAQAHLFDVDSHAGHRRDLRHAHVRGHHTDGRRYSLSDMAGRAGGSALLCRVGSAAHTSTPIVPDVGQGVAQS